MIKVAPSILAADMLNMGRDVQRMLDAGVDAIHVDIMDAHFVPNLSYGPGLVKTLHDAFDAPLDVHLMMDNPEAYLPVFIGNGAHWLTIHAEIPGDVAGMLRTIRELGAKAGLSVKPGTPVSAIGHLLPLCDLVLVMTVEPGFGGQSFMAEMIEKVRQLRAMGYTGVIEADGGVSLGNLPLLAEAGLDMAVMGTALYRSADPAADIAAVHAL
ncbi:MAG: ribulose-phosphate 3-epimerase [Clostridia bacterium]|nr:ribulose-phosphate 3-epimerase [Clostridia bacterium]